MVDLEPKGELPTPRSSFSIFNPKIRLAIYGSSLYEVKEFFFFFCDCFGLDFGGLGPPKPLISIEMVVISFFLECGFGVVWVASWAFLGPFWRPFGAS